MAVHTIMSCTMITLLDWLVGGWLSIVGIYRKTREHFFSELHNGSNDITVLLKNYKYTSFRGFRISIFYVYFMVFFFVWVDRQCIYIVLMNTMIG